MGRGLSGPLTGYAFRPRLPTDTHPSAPDAEELPNAGIFGSQKSPSRPTSVSN